MISLTFFGPPQSSKPLFPHAHPRKNSRSSIFPTIFDIPRHAVQILRPRFSIREIVVLILCPDTPNVLICPPGTMTIHPSFSRFSYCPSPIEHESSAVFDPLPANLFLFHSPHPPRPPSLIIHGLTALHHTDVCHRRPDWGNIRA